MNEFDTDLEGFKKRAKEVLDFIPKAKNLQSIENGIKALGLSYFNMKTEKEHELIIALSLLEYVTRKCMDKQLEMMINGVENEIE